MEEPRIRLGNDDVWLELARTRADSWQITADWSSWLTADFTADLRPRLRSALSCS